MAYIKKYGLRLLYTLIALLISLLLLTTLYYFNIISTNTYKIFKVVILLLNIFFSSFILGKNAQNKGFLEGIKFATIIIPIFFILTILTDQVLELRMLLYYLIILFSSILGGMVGISRKKESA